MSSRTAIRICGVVDGGGDDEEVNEDIFSLPLIFSSFFSLCIKSTAETRERDNMRECMKIS